MPLTDKVKKRLTDKAKDRASRVNASPEAWVNFLDNLSRQRRGIEFPSLSSPRYASEQPYSAYGLDPTGQFDLQGPVTQKLRLPDTNFLPGSNGAPLLTTESSTGRSLQDTKLWDDILSGAYLRSRGGDAGARSRGYMSQADEQAVLETTVPLWYRRTRNHLIDTTQRTADTFDKQIHHNPTNPYRTQVLSDPYTTYYAPPDELKDALTRSTSMSDITTAGDTTAARQVHAMAPDIETIRKYGLYDWTIPEGATDPAWLQYLSNAELKRRTTEAQRTSKEYGRKAAQYETAMGAGVDDSSDDPQQIQRQQMESILAARDMLDPDKREKLDDLVRNSLVDQHGAELTDEELYIALADDPIAIGTVFDGIAFEGLDSSEEARTASAFQGAYSQEAKAYRKQLETRASNEKGRLMEREAMADPQFDEIVEGYQGSRTTDLFSRAIANGRKSLSIADRVLLDLTTSNEDAMNYSWAYQYMSEDQKRVFAYYSAQSKEKGREYLDSIRPMLNARTAEGHRIAQGNFATRGPGEAVLSWATARATNLANVADIPGQFWDAIFGDADPNSWRYSNQAYTQNVTAAQAEWIAAHPDAINPLTGNNVWVDAYNWFGSAVDSGIAMGVGIAMGGGAPHFASLVTGFIQGGNAASSKLNEELTKGKGRAEAVIAAAACGAIEQASETWSVERILKEPAKFWLAAAKSWFAESSEEVVGYLGNTAADALISWTAQHENELQTRYNARLTAYQRETDMFGNRKYTDEECIKLADADVRQEYMQELANDALGGGFGGLFMFGVSHAANNVRTMNEARALVNRQLNGQTGSRSVSTNQTMQTVTQGERQQTQQTQDQQTPTQQTRDQQTPTQQPAQQDRPTTVLDATERQNAAEPQQAPQDQTQPAQQPAQPQAQQPAQTQPATQRVGGVNDTDTRELTPRQSRRAADQALRHIDQNQGVRDSVQGLVDIGATMDGEAKRQADKLGKQLKRGKVDALQLGRTYATVSQQLDEESRKAVGRAMYDPMVLAFMGDGMRSADAKVAAQAIIDRMDGKKLNRKQRHLLGKINNIDAVLGAAASARANALSEEEKTERGQRIKKLQGLFTPEVDGKPSQTAERQAAAIDDAAQDSMDDVEVPSTGRDNSARYTAEDGTESRVQILRIRRADGTTKVTIKHADGRTEEISSEKLGGFGSETAALLVDAAEPLSDTAEQNVLNDGELNLALQVLDPAAEGEQARTNVAAFFSVYNAGFDGFAVPEAARQVLGDRTDMILNAARADALEAEKTRMANVRKAGKPGTGKIDTSAIDGQQLTPEQQASVNFIRQITGVLPVNVSLFASQANEKGEYTSENGRYDPNTDTIYIDIHSGMMKEGDTKQIILQIVKHEFSHWLEAHTGKGYRAFADKVLQTLGREKTNERVIQQALKAEGSGVRLTRGGALSELVADASYEMMLNGRGLVEMFKAMHPGQQQQLHDFMYGLAQNLRAATMNGRATTPESEAIRAAGRSAVNELQALWDAAITDAVGEDVTQQTAQPSQEPAKPSSDTVQQRPALDDSDGMRHNVDREGLRDQLQAETTPADRVQPVDEIAQNAPEQSDQVADRVEQTVPVQSDQVADRVVQSSTENADQVADRVEQTSQTQSDQVADRVLQTSQTPSDQVAYRVTQTTMDNADGIRHFVDREGLRDQMANQTSETTEQTAEQPVTEQEQTAQEQNTEEQAEQDQIEQTAKEQADQTQTEQAAEEQSKQEQTDQTQQEQNQEQAQQGQTEHTTQEQTRQQNLTQQGADEAVNDAIMDHIEEIRTDLQQAYSSFNGRMPAIDYNGMIEMHNFLQSRIFSSPEQAAQELRALSAAGQRNVLALALQGMNAARPGKVVNDYLKGRLSAREVQELVLRAQSGYRFAGLNQQTRAQYWRQGQQATGGAVRGFEGLRQAAQQQAAAQAPTQQRTAPAQQPAQQAPTQQAAPAQQTWKMGDNGSFIETMDASEDVSGDRVSAPILLLNDFTAAANRGNLVPRGQVQVNGTGYQLFQDGSRYLAVAQSIIDKLAGSQYDNAAARLARLTTGSQQMEQANLTAIRNRVRSYADQCSQNLQMLSGLEAMAAEASEAAERGDEKFKAFFVAMTDYLTSAAGVYDADTIEKLDRLSPNGLVRLINSFAADTTLDGYLEGIRKSGGQVQFSLRSNEQGGDQQYSIRDLRETTRLRSEENEAVNETTFMQQLMASGALSGTEQNIVRQFLNLGQQIADTKNQLAQALVDSADETKDQMERTAARNRADILKKQLRRMERQQAQMRDDTTFQQIALQAVQQSYDIIDHATSEQQLRNEIGFLRTRADQVRAAAEALRDVPDDFHPRPNSREDAQMARRDAELNANLRKVVQRLFPAMFKSDQNTDAAVRDMARRLDGYATTAGISYIRNQVRYYALYLEAGRTEEAKACLRNIAREVRGFRSISDTATAEEEFQPTLDAAMYSTDSGTANEGGTRWDITVTMRELFSAMGASQSANPYQVLNELNALIRPFGGHAEIDLEADRRDRQMRRAEPNHSARTGNIDEVRPFGMGDLESLVMHVRSMDESSQGRRGARSVGAMLDLDVAAARADLAVEFGLADSEGASLGTSEEVADATYEMAEAADLVYEALTNPTDENADVRERVPQDRQAEFIQRYEAAEDVYADFSIKVAQDVLAMLPGTKFGGVNYDAIRAFLDALRTDSETRHFWEEDVTTTYGDGVRSTVHHASPETYTRYKVKTTELINAIEQMIKQKQGAINELGKYDKATRKLLADAMLKRALNRQAESYERQIAMLKTRNTQELMQQKQKYEDRIRKIKDEAKAKQRQIIRAERTKADNRVAAERAKADQRMQSLKDAQKTKDSLRDMREEIAKHEKAIRRAIAEIDSLIRGETDRRNVHESMKPLAEKLVKIFAVHDATVHSIVFSSNMAAEIVAEYQKLATLDGDVTNGMYDQSVIDALNNAVDLLKRADAATTNKGSREEQLNQARLRAAALEELRNAITQITHMIKNAGTIFRQNGAESLERAAESVAGPMRARGDYSGRFDGNATAFVGTNNLTMPYFVRRINNRGFTGLVNEIFHGGDTVYGRRLGEAQSFIQDTANRFHYWTWANTPNDTLKLNVDGRQMEFTREQALFVLAAWNREHNTGSLIESHHLDRGGLVTEAERRRFGQRADSDISHFTGARVDQTTIDAIKRWLTPEQVAYMDAMVDWMSTTLADWGNETSMKLFGIKKYKEGMYFPFTVFKGNMAQSPISNTASTTNDTAISHPGFSHRRIGQASTPILLGEFSDVVAMHAAQMLSYSSLAVPMLNLNSVLNHRVAIDTDTQRAHEERIQDLEQQLKQKQMERDDARHNGEKDEWQQLRQEVANLREQIAEEQERLRAESVSVRSMFQQKYGQNMASYLSAWMRDMQGGVMQDTREQAYDKLVSLFKKGAVVGSMSVAMQQPLSYIRAATNIDARYLGQALVRNWRGSQEQMMRYSGTANIKAMGRFDVGVNAGSRAYLLERDGQDYTFFKKLREAIGMDTNGHFSFDTFKNRWDKIFGFMPQKMDTITWCRMWEAVKLEQAASNPGMDTSSEAFLMKCGERFDELMRLTQVYDSTIVRSANMRSKSALMKMTTAFMAEPTISLNVMADAVDGLMHGRKGANLGCAVTTFALSAILQALIKGLWGAGRKDDKDKTMLEKWAASFGYNFIGEINPLTLIPGASDLIDMLNGKTIEREDMTLLTDLVKQGQKLMKTLNGESGGYTSVYQGIEYFGGSIAKLLGVPVKNVMRDMRAMWNFAMGNADRPTNWNVAGRALTENIMSELPFGDTSNKAYYNDILSAMLRGDADEAASLRDYLTLGKGVKETTVASGVKSALKTAMEAGGVSLEDGWEVCEKFGIFTDKSKYYNWAQGAMNPAESEDDKAGTKWTELDTALKTGKPVTAIRQELGQYGIDDAAITSHVRTSVDDWYMSGEISRETAESILRQYSGQTDNEMYWTFKEWDARKAHAGDASYKYTKYETLWDAIDSGKSVKAPVTELQTYFPGDPKNFKSTVSSAITSRYKPMYIELMNQGRKTEAANLLGYVLSAYEAIGYDRSAKLADIQKNWK